MRKWLGLILFCGLLLLGGQAIAQEAPLSPDATCPALVFEALERLEDNCSGLDRNTACYGYTSVQATFQQPVSPDFFTHPADTAELVSLQSLWTAPMHLENQEWGLALMNVQANVPGTLPGQAVMFLLIGDVQVENRVLPEELPLQAQPIQVTALTDAPLFGHPSPDATILMTVPANTLMAAEAVSEDAEWVRVVGPDDIAAWAPREMLNPTPEIDTLPRVNPRRMSPMQAFQFSSGVGPGTCTEASGTLLIQGPNNVLVDIEANGANITIGSTIALTQTAANELQITTLSGTAYVDGVTVPAGYQTTAPMDEEGQVAGTWSEPVQVPAESMAGQSIDSGLFHYDVMVPGLLPLVAQNPNAGAAAGVPASTGSTALPNVNSLPSLGGGANNGSQPAPPVAGGGGGQTPVQPVPTVAPAIGGGGGQTPVQPVPTVAPVVGGGNQAPDNSGNSGSQPEHPHGGPPGQTGEHPNGGPPGQSNGNGNNGNGNGNGQGGQSGQNGGNPNTGSGGSTNPPGPAPSSGSSNESGRGGNTSQPSTNNSSGNTNPPPTSPPTTNVTQPPAPAPDNNSSQPPPSPDNNGDGGNGHPHGGPPGQTGEHPENSNRGGGNNGNGNGNGGGNNGNGNGNGGGDGNNGNGNGGGNGGGNGRGRG